MPLPPELRRPLHATELRVRAQRALDGGVLFALPGLGLAGLTLALVKTEALPEPSAVPWLVLAAAFPLLGAAVGALRRVPSWLPSKLLDRTHGLDDRLTNAVTFADHAEPTAFMRAAIEDALERARRGLEPSRAMPLSVPQDVLSVFGAALGVLALGVLEVPRYVERPVVITHSIDAVALHADDLDAYESELRGLLDNPDTPEPVRDAAHAFNRIVEDLADARLDRAESLRRIAELERQLQATRPAGAELMRESLEQLGQDLRRADLAEELSAALRDGDASRAEAEMRRLAEQLQQDDESRAELERLRRALSRAAENQPSDRTEEIQRREEEMQRLLRRQQEQAEETPRAERRLLQRRQRELDRLRRENQEAMERRRQLERLQREMNRAAQNLQDQQREQAGEDLERGAEDLNRMAREQLSDEQMRNLQQQLEQLREQIRQQQRAQGGQQGQQQRGQGQQGQGHGQQGQSQMDRFVMRANGEGNTQLRMPGQQGQGQQGQGQQGQGQQGQGQQGQGQQGQGQQGQGQQG
ncbi:MAG: hypothetical protein AB8I08_38810, partial [Sandaracinaceae bacterium]